jgi:transcriptional regulator with XRE-family HTH domain
MTNKGSTTKTSAASPSAEKVKALRARLGLTQEALSKQCGERHTFIPSIEGGKNKATTTRAVLALAQGAGVTVIAMLDYLRGALSLDEMLPAKGGAP